MDAIANTLGPAIELMGEVSVKIFEYVGKTLAAMDKAGMTKGALSSLSAFKRYDLFDVVLQGRDKMDKRLDKINVKATEVAKVDKPDFDFRGSKFDIKQEFAEGFDPDRIAAVFSNDLAKLGERRLQSGLSPIFGGI
jgi:hypothetical protein